VQRRRLAVAIGLVLIVPSIAGIVALAAGGDSIHESTPAVTTTAPTRISTPTAAPPPPPPSASNPAEPGTASTSSTSMSTATTAPSTTTSTTIAPIVTHDARVGVGVLTPAAEADAPVRVEVPSIDADGPVRPGGVDATGGLEIPGDAKELVWWKYGPTPGEPGSAVIAGHLDRKHVLGVFNRLGDMHRGDPVTVTYASGRTQGFVVDSVELVDKPAVAIDGTFTRDGAPVLRLVTCGGDFDYGVHHYKSNVVVTAHPV
jgi:LPXTG-site transpeptidase (sortase) family protein